MFYKWSLRNEETFKCEYDDEFDDYDEDVINNKHSRSNSSWSLWLKWLLGRLLREFRLIKWLCKLCNNHVFVFIVLKIEDWKKETDQLWTSSRLSIPSPSKFALPKAPIETPQWLVNTPLQSGWLEAYIGLASKQPQQKLKSWERRDWHGGSIW